MKRIESNEKLFEKMKLGEDSRDKIIENNLKLVYYFAHKFKRNKEEIDDLASIGTIALIKAVDTFDSNKNIKFVTYASTCICNSIFMYFRSDKKHKDTASLDNILLNTNSLELMETIYSKDDAIDQNIIKLCDRNDIIESLNVLDEIELKIVLLYYYDELLQNQIAIDLNVSQPFVSRTLAKALDKIQKYITNINDENMIWHFIKANHPLDDVLEEIKELDTIYQDIIYKYHGYDLESVVRVDALDDEDKLLLLKAYKLLSDLLNKNKELKLQM